MEKTTVTVTINGQNIELLKPTVTSTYTDTNGSLIVTQTETQSEKVINQLLLALDGITVEKKKEWRVTIKWNETKDEIYTHFGECFCGETCVMVGSKYCQSCGCTIINPLITRK